MVMVAAAAVVVAAGGRRQGCTGEEEVAESDERLSRVDGKEERNLQNGIAKRLDNIPLPQHRTLPPPAVGVGSEGRQHCPIWWNGRCAREVTLLLLYYYFTTTLLLLPDYFTTTLQLL